jgi:putative transposase
MGDVAIQVRELVRQICEIFEIRIIKGVVSKDHIPILVSAPPTRAPSEIMRRIKGKTSSPLFEEFPALKKRYWGHHFWARSYFCTTACKLPMGGISTNTPSISSIRTSSFRWNFQEELRLYGSDA